MLKNGQKRFSRSEMKGQQSIEVKVREEKRF